MTKPTIDQLTEFHEQMKAGRVTRENFQAYLANPDGFLNTFPSLTIAANLIPKGWEIVEDVAPTLKSASDLEFISFLEPGESVTQGETMRQRAKKINANLGLADAKFLLEHQAEIPTEMRRFYFVFGGTVLRDPGGNLFVAYLYWDGDRWVVRFRWLGGAWLVYDRLARCK